MFGKLFAFIASSLGALAAVTATQGCVWLVWDEPTTPKSIIEK